MPLILAWKGTVQLSRCFERSRNAQKILIPSKNVVRVTRASLASHSRVTRKFYVIQFASDAQSSFGSHGSLRDARRDSSHYKIQVHVLIKGICKLLLFLLSFNAVFVNDAQFNYNYMYVWLLS